MTESRASFGARPLNRSEGITKKECFPFLDLPRELRDQIYRDIVNTRRSELPGPTLHANLYTSRHLSNNLSRVCHAIRYEYLEECTRIAKQLLTEPSPACISEIDYFFMLPYLQHLDDKLRADLPIIKLNLEDPDVRGVSNLLDDIMKPLRNSNLNVRFAISIKDREAGELLFYLVQKYPEEQFGRLKFHTYIQVARSNSPNSPWSEPNVGRHSLSVAGKAWKKSFVK
ncbi:MAG: hypothetical protein M1820_005989 [Bogoriella megaspora]|nr:MAG: hypothetical protein M1820_005989 [Bogoriella megaspora]